MQHCASYDAQVSEWMWSKVGEGPPPMLSIPMQLQQPLRYGENPHQNAAFYTDSSLREAGAGGVAQSTVHWGKEMSYNNFLVRAGGRVFCVRTCTCGEGVLIAWVHA